MGAIAGRSAHLFGSACVAGSVAGNREALNQPFVSTSSVVSASTMRIVASFLEDMKAINETGGTHVALEGYINAAVLAQGIRDAGPALNTAAFVRTMEGLNIDLGGPVVAFTPSSRQGLKEVYLSCIRQGQVVKVENFNP